MVLRPKGLTGAQLELGVMYLIGQFVPQDYVLAHLWFNLQLRKRRLIKTTGIMRSKFATRASKMMPAQIADAELVGDWFGITSYNLEPTYSLSTVSDQDSRHTIARLNEQLQSKFWWTIQLVVAVVLGVAIFAAIDGRSALPLFGLHRTGGSTNITAANGNNGEQTASPDGKNMAAPAKVASRPGILNIPIPSAYGIYAVTNGKLAEIDVLPIKVPDQRIAISTPISTPSRAHLPIGQLQFVVFRRDLASDAPDRVAVRVVAQVVRSEVVPVV